MLKIKIDTIKSKDLVDNVKVTEKGNATLGEYMTLVSFGIENLLDTLPKEKVLEIIKSFVESHQ